ncbi:MAG: hypothetical protein CMJ09_00620 [Pelagibacterales bacterium]|nr:hypothetical protein [Pelagibacterales bacterium]|tara:strand:+ start:9406 stop:10014 length:609 start_codon:yes stop_codon:yes gene_type:complete
MKVFPNLKSTTDKKNILKILTDINKGVNSSQRSMSFKLGISAGLANSYIKRCVSKGWVKIKSVPKRRYMYYLTPKGFLEKSKLTAEYLSSSFELYRNMRNECHQILLDCKKKKIKKIYLSGQSELTEVLILTAKELDVAFEGLFIFGSNKKDFFGVEVCNYLPIEKIDKIILCDMKSSFKALAYLKNSLNKDKIIVPKILNI